MHYPGINFVFSEEQCTNKYKPRGRACIPRNFVPTEHTDVYVEVTLEGCKYLCNVPHDQTCRSVKAGVQRRFLPTPTGTVLKKSAEKFTSGIVKRVKRKRAPKGVNFANFKSLGDSAEVHKYQHAAVAVSQPEGKFDQKSPGAPSHSTAEFA